MPHWIFYGMTRSGKSYYVKSEFIEDPDIYNNKQIFILDVTGEYEKYEGKKNIKYYFIDNSDPDEGLYKKLDRKILGNNRHKMIIIDECHLIGENNTPFMKHIIKWVTTGAKYNVEMVILTQRPQLIHSKTPHSQSYFRIYFAMDNGDIEALRQSKFVSKEIAPKLMNLDVDKHEFIMQEKKNYLGPFIL